MSRESWNDAVVYWAEEREQAKQDMREQAARRNHSGVLRAISKRDLCGAAIEALYEVMQRGEVQA